MGPRPRPALSALQRLRGLAFRDLGAVDAPLLIERCRSVHTFGMRFALDLVWLDAAGAVVRVDRGVPPRRLRTCVRARSVVEIASGGAQAVLDALCEPAAVTRLRPACLDA